MNDKIKSPESDKRTIYADVVEALMKNDEDKARERLFFLHPQDLNGLALVCDILSRLCYEVWADYPEPDLK